MMNAIVMPACRTAAFRGVRREECNLPNMAGRYRSRLAAYTSLEDVKKDPEIPVSVAKSYTSKT